MCHALEDMRACVALQRDVWKFTDAELVPLRLFVVAEKVGGQVVGAFEGDAMVGFALAIPGHRSGHSFLYSHMLAVRQDYRDHGLGKRLKLFQRDDALRRGFDLMEWTFDPLEIKNAYLNIEKLGAIARRYNVNQYGITSSPLQGGLPTDRLIAEWWMRSERVEARLRDGTTQVFQVEREVAVPAEIYAWKAGMETKARALEVQDRNREALRQAFSEGLAVLGYARDPQGNGVFQLGRWNEKWLYAAD
jgi:predicted GNAT superfamily acetyltransferase